MVYVVDLFCGAGGFSAGATAAGAHVVLAVDCWEKALEVHSLNHKDSVHWCAKLGSAIDSEQFCARVRRFLAERGISLGEVHVHGSPPCQDLSSFSYKTKDPARGMVMVNWFLNVVKLLAPGTWSMEQVSHASIANLLPADTHRVYHLDEFGVPNTRTRLIAGTVHWQKLETLKQRAPSSGTVLERVNEDTAGYDSLMSFGRKADGSYYNRPLSSVAYTVVQSAPRLYNTASRKMKNISLQGLQALQTFSPEYLWGNTGKEDARKMIANAVPPLMAMKIIQCIFN